MKATVLLTLNPAKLLGLEKRKGVIALGVDADMVVFDNGYQPAACCVGGASGTAPYRILHPYREPLTQFIHLLTIEQDAEKLY